MLSFNSFWKKKDKKYSVDTKSSNLPPVDDDVPTKEKDVPTQVSDYISAKYSG